MSNIDDDDDYKGGTKVIDKTHTKVFALSIAKVYHLCKDELKRKPIENLKEILREEVIEKTIPEKLRFVKHHTKSLQETHGIVQMTS